MSRSASDNADAAASLVALLRIVGHEAMEANDGNTALRLVGRERPAVVLLDIGLPDLNGHEVCRRARQLPGGAEMVVVALTGWGQKNDLRQTREAGFDAHLTKPVDLKALERLLDELTRETSPDAQAS